MGYYVNEEVAGTKRVFPEQGRYDYYRYDMNENPEGLPKEFVDAVLKEITPEFLATYPEPDKFIKKYAQFVGAKYENILTTNGSDMAIRYLLEIFGEKGKEVVTVSPSFEMYRVNCSILGLKHVPVLYEKDMTMDVNKIVKTITNDTSIVVLLNPNNPIGNTYTEEEVEHVIEKAKMVNAIVIIDEAYHYFYSGTFMKYALEEENVVLLRTFSKMFSLAACRLGIIISNKKIVDYVRNARLTFEVNSIALLFAERLLEHPQMIEELIETEREGKEYLVEELCSKGYECKVGKGNFCFVKTHNDANEIAVRLKDEKKILVHAYSNELLKDYLRVSTGSKSSMRIFVEALQAVDN